jgi:hypothetical protein
VSNDQDDQRRPVRGRDGTYDERDDKYWESEWAEADAQDAKRAELSGRSWLAWRKENEGRAPYSAWLVIPAHLTDYGLRPLTGPYWASPNIWVESPHPSGQPVAGQPNFVHASVYNLGAATSAPTEVSFFWCNPSVGLGAPDAHYIGKELLEIQPMSSVDVRCNTPWIPDYVNDGHECLFAIAHNHVTDPVLKPFQPWADRHVGQRNVNVLPAVQMMQSLWVPLADYDQASEIFACALLARAREEFAWAGTPVATLAAAADQVLNGLHRQVLKGRQPAQDLLRTVFAKQISAWDVIESVGLTADMQPFAKAQEGQAAPAFPDAEQATLGDLMLRLPAGPGTMARLEIELRETDLARNELLVINVTHVNRGRVAGGYAITLANAAWFEDVELPERPTQDATVRAVMAQDETTQKHTTATGEPMAQFNDSVLETLVIEHNPQARVTYQVARQLARYLPIESLDQLREQRPYLVLDEERFPIELLLPYIDERLLPVRDLDDLVAKVSAGTRVAQTLGERAVERGDNDNAAPVAALVRKLKDGPGRASSIPSGHFAGPSLYGVEQSKGDK